MVWCDWHGVGMATCQDVNRWICSANGIRLLIPWRSQQNPSPSPPSNTSLSQGNGAPSGRSHASVTRWHEHWVSEYEGMTEREGRRWRRREVEAETRERRSKWGSIAPFTQPAHGGNVAPLSRLSLRIKRSEPFLPTSEIGSCSETTAGDRPPGTKKCSFTSFPAF